MKQDKIILLALLLCMAGEIVLLARGNTPTSTVVIAETPSAVQQTKPAIEASPEPSTPPSPSPTPKFSPIIAPEDGMQLLSQSIVAGKELSEELINEKETYQQALDLLYMRHFDEARELFLSLGDYKDSTAKAKYCITYPANEPEAEKVIVTEKNIYTKYEHGIVYKLGDIGGEKYTGLVYIPDEINAQTAFVQYYSGGEGAGDDYLWRPGIEIYFKTYSPNAIFMFTNEPGTGHMEWRNAVQYDILRQIAKECGTILHDLSTVGSSNGCYTCMKLAAYYYLNYGIRVKNVCTLDTGEYWGDEYLKLSEKEAEAIAEAGTQFYLFEEQAFREDICKSCMQHILRAGIETYVFICHHQNHSVISENAYSLGIFSFSVDPYHTILPTYEYWMMQIDANTTPDDIKGFTYTEKPEDDTRMVF